MLAPLRERYRVGWIEAIGADPRFAKLRVPGGHLFPFEHPLLAAAAVAELLGRLPA